MFTAAPRELAERGVGGEFVGYYSSDGSWNPVGCATSYGITLSSTYFACAPSTATSFGIATTCVDGSVLPNPSGVFTCDGSCCSITLVIDGVDPSIFMDYACGICRETLYRDIPTTASSAIASSTSSLVGITSSLINTPTSNPSFIVTYLTSSPSTFGVSSSFSHASSSSPAANSTHTSSPNRAWIAGAVIGPLVAVAIIAGLGFWVWKLKNRSPTVAVPVQERIVYYDPSGRAELELRSPPNHLQVVQEPEAQPAEVPDNRFVPELPTPAPGR